MQNSKFKIKEGLVIFCLFILALVLFVLVIRFGTYTLGKENPNAQFGVTFSTLRARELGLDWRKAYVAVLEDLRAKLVRIPIYWNDVEKEEGKYDFGDYGWMVSEAQKRGVIVIPVIGMRVPRWPECHVPSFYEGKHKTQNSKLKTKEGSNVIETTPLLVSKDSEYVQDLQRGILRLLEEEVQEFKGYPNILYWQVENEPMLKAFGRCPFHDLEFIKKELKLVRKLDPSRGVMTSDSGELSSWIDLAEAADVLGVSLYRVTFNKYFGFYYYPLPPLYYRKKAELVSHLVDKIVLSELQGEPWTQGMPDSDSPQRQLNAFSLRRMKDTVSFAKKTGIDTILLWGVEWWYDMKEVQGHPEYWEYMKGVMSE